MDTPAGYQRAEVAQLLCDLSTMACILEPSISQNINLPTHAFVHVRAGARAGPLSACMPAADICEGTGICSPDMQPLLSEYSVCQSTSAHCPAGASLPSHAGARKGEARALGSGFFLK